MSLFLSSSKYVLTGLKIELGVQAFLGIQSKDPR